MTYLKAPMFIIPRTRFFPFAMQTYLLFCLLMVPSIAYAQAVGAAPALSVGAIVMLSVSFLFGLAVQAQASGKLLGQFVIPAKAMVVVALAVPFLGGVSTYLGGVTFSESAVLYAVFHGLTNVVSSAAGGAAHAHFDGISTKTAARLARIAAAGPAGVLMLLLAAGCTAAEVQAWDQGVAAGSSIVVPAAGFACAIAQDVDPSGATAICQEIDTAGALVGQAFTVAESAPAIIALVAKTSATMQTQVRAHYLAQKH